MADESIYLNATLRDRFLAAVTQDRETTAQRLAHVAEGAEGLHEQREEAWHLLSEGVGWAAKALASVGVDGTDEKPIHDPDVAFDRAQHLDAQLLKLSQLDQYHDEVALLVDAVKRACYHSADLGPGPGGRISSFRSPREGIKVRAEIEPNLTDLQEIGGALGEALVRLGDLHLGNPVETASGLFLPVAA